MNTEASETKMLTINFLGAHPPINVEMRPIIHHPAGQGFPAYDTCDLSIGWGDRESDIQTGPQNIARSVKMLPPKVYRARLTDYEMALVSDAEVQRVQELVKKIWSETPTVAPACESYRIILQGIHDRYLPQSRPMRRERAKFVVRGGKRNYVVDGQGWESVTDVACPVCLTGVVKWNEAGYAPGHRKCDSCGRHYVATCQALGAQAPAGKSLLQLETI